MRQTLINRECEFKPASQAEARVSILQLMSNTTLQAPTFADNSAETIITAAPVLKLFVRVADRIARCLPRMCDYQSAVKFTNAEFNYNTAVSPLPVKRTRDLLPPARVGLSRQSSTHTCHASLIFQTNPHLPSSAPSSFFSHYHQNMATKMGSFPAAKFTKSMRKSRPNTK